MTTRKRAISRAQEAKEEPVQQVSPEPVRAMRTTAEHVQAALDELDALGAKRTYNQVNALSYLKQAQSWLQRDDPTDNK